MKIKFPKIDFKNLLHKKISEPIALTIIFGIIFISVFFYPVDSEESKTVGTQIASVTGINTDTTTENTTSTNISAGCNYKKIPLTGMLITYWDGSEGNYAVVDYVVAEIQKAVKNEKTKAIILEIDSAGGYPVAGEEVMNALKNSGKKTVALIRQGGLSAAYMAALGADKIFASKFSDVGSIGVTFSYADFTSKNAAEGVIFNQLSSGKYKDMMNPDKPLTEEEKALIMRDVKIMHENFINLVAERRKLSVEKVRAMADGSSMLGEMALKNGLIDKIGGIEEVKAYLKDELGTDPVICEEESLY